MEYYATLGPACADRETLVRMFRYGMTGVRLNLSHGDLEQDRDWLRCLRDAAGICGASPEILIDLMGPSLRLLYLNTDLDVNVGDLISFGAGTELLVPEMLLEFGEDGDHLLLDDGKLEFEVLTTAGASGRGADSFLTRVLRGGRILPGKSLALVGKELPMPTLTESDRKNIRQAAQYGVTGVMLPFVRNKEDLLTLRQALHEAGSPGIRIFAKIENMQGVANLDELIPYADHIVIARGDLGNAMPLWKLPGVQKTIARKCAAAGKPFMVVTQMLDSMHEKAAPTRAEVLDIYNAVLDGASSVMLTGETAAGKYPAEAMMYLVNTGEEARRDR